MKIEWRGNDKLSKKLRSNIELNLAKNIVKTNTAEMDRGMKARAVFTKGYATGQTKRSITSELSNGGLTGTVGPHTDYASYVEYGTRHMAAQSFIRPAFNHQKELFKRDMDRLK